MHLIFESKPTIKNEWLYFLHLMDGWSINGRTPWSRLVSDHGVIILETEDLLSLAKKSGALDIQCAPYNNGGSWWSAKTEKWVNFQIQVLALAESKDFSETIEDNYLKRERRRV